MLCMNDGVASEILQQIIEQGRYHRRHPHRKTTEVSPLGSMPPSLPGKLTPDVRPIALPTDLISHSVRLTLSRRID